MIRSRLKQFNIGSYGIEYLRTKLATTGMSRELLSLPLHQGSSYAVLPHGTSPERSLQFETGGLGLRQMSENRTWLAEHLADLALKYPTGTIIFQDVFGGRPGDSGLGKRTTSMIFNQSDLYHVVTARQATTEVVGVAMHELTSFLLVGAFINLEMGEADVSADRFVQDSFIEKVTNAVKEIYVSAYDLEGLVIWKSEAQPHS